MNKKALALIIAGLVILIAIIYFIFIYDFSGGQNNPPATDTTSTEQVNPAEPIVSKSSPAKPATTEKINPAEQNRATATQLAISFAERYGTSSSQSDFSNLTDAEVFMTASLAATTNKFITTERNKVSDGIYKSIVTKAVIVDFTSFNETAGMAEGLVKTKRLKTEIDGKTSSYDQNLAISLKKVGAEWKVDKADWK